MNAMVSFENVNKEYSYFTNDRDLKEGDMVVVTSKRFGGYSVGVFKRYTKSMTLPKQNIVLKLTKDYFEKSEEKVLRDKENLLGGYINEKSSL
ncbi:hypothetical protein IR073_06600 [Gemella sp. 19428wG2_WT2a]|nr:hypothetical protein [Gemella sp. 19428wG2_WT2a]TFU57704.1 hypothetical protein E4T67_06525 [Gemella sp. WT2a]